MIPADLPAAWRGQADALRRFGADAQAKVCEELAADLEAALAAEGEEELYLDDAAAESGYSLSQLRRLFPGRKKVPRRCLPRKPSPIAALRLEPVSSPVQIAREILNRG